MSALKDRIAGAEQAGLTEESPIAALFKAGAAPAPKAPSSFPVSTSPQLRDLPVDAMDEMDQPFRLYNDAQMELMRENIAERGIIQRIIVRPNPDKPGRYQIISGRNRRRGAMLAGYTTVPCEIRFLDDHEARLQMVDANLRQREELLPSEKAWAYRIRLEELAHQGKKTGIEKSENPFNQLGENEKPTSPQIAAKLRSDDAIGADAGKSGDTIQRYVRLTYLMPELLEAVDNKTLGFGVGVTLSYLSEDYQQLVYQYFFIDHKQKISGVTASWLRTIAEKGALTEDKITAFLSPAVNIKPLRKVSISMKPLQKYFPAGSSQKDIEREIIEIVKAKKEGTAQEPPHDGWLPMEWIPDTESPKGPMAAVAKFDVDGSQIQRLAQWDGSRWNFPGPDGSPIDAKCVAWWPVPGDDVD